MVNSKINNVVLMYIVLYPLLINDISRVLCVLMFVCMLIVIIIQGITIFDGCFYLRSPCNQIQKTCCLKKAIDQRFQYLKSFK